MIMAIAHLNVIPGREEEFEKAFQTARAFVARSEGFHGLELQRSVENPSRYALVSRWRKVEDHGAFRKSPAYPKWSELLGGFFDGAPEVAHYRCVAEAFPE